MSPYGYIFVAGMTFVAGLVAVAWPTAKADENWELAAVRYKEEARSAAITALNVTISTLGNDPETWTELDGGVANPIKYRSESFEAYTSVDRVRDTVYVLAVGTRAFRNLRGLPTDTTHAISVSLVLGPDSDPNARRPFIVSWAEN